MQKLRFQIREARDLGPRKFIYRLSYELKKRLGVFEYRDRVFLKNYSIPQLTFEEWKEKKAGFFFEKNLPFVKHSLQQLSENDKQEILDRAKKSKIGVIRCFSRSSYSYQNPINWHFNPYREITWPGELHWSKAMSFKGGGDIKFVWEVNRFPHFYDLIRAFLLTEDDFYLDEILRQIKNWDEQNPYSRGVNWASEQEVAIRILTWIFAIYVISEFRELSDEEFRIFLKQVGLHIQHIYRHVDFAENAVHNNHLIAAGLALYAGGLLFPQFKYASKWLKKGRSILEREIDRQFYDDGGYCQLSHTYHRLALHYYLWAIRLAEENGQKFPLQIYQTLKKSAYLLYQNMNPLDGKLPNWGNNDGALFCPWTSCDYSDFRPVLASLYAICSGRRVFAPGPWDEEILWFVGDKNLHYQPIIQKTTKFSEAGLYVLRKSYYDFAVFRCGTPKDRFAQADQLHMDVFFNGENIAPDGGSFLYNDEDRYHQYFMGTASHNTVTVDGKNQMLLWRKFKWLYMPPAEVQEWMPDRLRIAGAHTGFRLYEKGICHTRRVSWTEKILAVTDLIEFDSSNQKNHEIELHWNFKGDVKPTQKSVRENILFIQTNEQHFWVYLISKTQKGAFKSEINLKSAYDDGSMVDGWISRYYGNKERVCSVRLKVLSNCNTYFFSLFSPRKLTDKEIENWISY